MTNYKLLLPPSEGKLKSINKQNLYEKVKGKNSFPKLNRPRNELYNFLIKILSSKTNEKIEKILELKGNNLDNAIRVNFNQKKESTLPAIQRYVGIMFSAINYNTMNQTQKTNFNDSVLFIDAMFGLLKTRDLIPEYKLKISTKIPNFDIVNFWKENLSVELEKEFKGKLVIDILPDTHRKVIGSKYPNYYRIMFAEKKDNTIKNVGHISKMLKGEFVRYITEVENISYETLENFKHSLGFKFSKKYSKDDLIVYLK